MQNRLILITGFPATGKTTLGKTLAKRLLIPLISRDDLKEILFDRLGWKDREWSKKCGAASYDLLFHIMGLLLSARQSSIVESNFHPEFDKEKILSMKKKYGFDFIQIVCRAQRAVLFERFKKRAKSGERHPGHVDVMNSEEFKKTLLSGRVEPLSIPGKIIEVDTTRFENVDVEEIVRVVEMKKK